MLCWNRAILSGNLVFPVGGVLLFGVIFVGGVAEETGDASFRGGGLENER